MRESGLTNIALFDNPTSILTDRSTVVLVEKRHTMAHSRHPWDTHTATRMRKDRASRTPAQEKEAWDRRSERDGHVINAALASNLGGRIVEASIDTAHVEQLRDYATEDGGRRGVAQKVGCKSWRKHAEKAREAIEQVAPVRHSLRTSWHCTHLEEHPGLALTKEYVRVPAKIDVPFCSVCVVSSSVCHILYLQSTACYGYE